MSNMFKKTLEWSPGIVMESFINNIILGVLYLTNSIPNSILD